MNKYLIFSIVSITFGILVYISSNNIFLSVSIGVIFLAYFIFYAIPKLKKYLSENETFFQCSQFISSYIISLSISDSFDNAFESALKSLKPSFIESYSINLKEHSPQSLTLIFDFNEYHLFLDTLDMYQEEGGDILKCSEYLLKEIRNNQDYLVESNRLVKKSLFEFSLLWIISLSILVFIRFALKQFYSSMIKSNIYVIGIGVIFVFLLLSMHIFVLRICSTTIKREKYEK